MTVALNPIAIPRRESELWPAFETLRPAALAVLANSVSSALRNVRDVDLNVTRLPDAAAWAAAAGPALGLREEDIIEAVSSPHTATAQMPTHG